MSGVAVAADTEDEASAPVSSPTVRNIEASESASPIVSLGAPDSPRDWLTLIGGVVLLVTIIVWQGTLFRRRRQEHERVLHRLESLGRRRTT